MYRHLARKLLMRLGMESNLSPSNGDIATLNSLLQSAQWDVGILIVPTTEDSNNRTEDSETTGQEVR